MVPLRSAARAAKAFKKLLRGECKQVGREDNHRRDDHRSAKRLVLPRVLNSARRLSNSLLKGCSRGSIENTLNKVSNSVIHAATDRCCKVLNSANHADIIRCCYASVTTQTRVKRLFLLLFLPIGFDLVTTARMEEWRRKMDSAIGKWE